MPTETPKPAPPKNLGAAGRALWRALHAEIEWDPHETPQVAQACAQADLVADLEALVATEGLTTIGSSGQTRLSGAVTELRQSRLALSRLLGALQIPNEEELTPAQLRGRRAAEARYGRMRSNRGPATA